MAFSSPFDFSALFGQKNPSMIGLDISTSGIKVVELARVGKHGDLRLERYAQEPLPRGAIVDGNIESIDQVSQAIQRALKKCGARAKLVALGMPPAAVITKKIILPGGLSEDELEVQVESEASQYIPFALDEVSLDFDVIGVAANSPEDIEVLLAATRKEKVEDRMAVAEAAGLTPTVMDIESYAARAALERITRDQRDQHDQLDQTIIAAKGKHAVAAGATPAGKTAGKTAGTPAGTPANKSANKSANHPADKAAGKIFALIQIGANATHVSMLQDGQLLYEREQPFGGAQLTQDIVRAYGLSYEEAEVKKRSADLPEGYEREWLEPFLDTAASEVTRAIQFFYTSTPFTQVDQIYLAGGCAIMPGLVDLVAERSRISCAVISPFEGMQMGPGVREKQLRLDAPSFLVACGLALRRFD